jgi:hypothetical protein
MSEWMAWCFQTASCIWWPFDTHRDFTLYIVVPVSALSLLTTWLSRHDAPAAEGGAGEAP